MGEPVVIGQVTVAEGDFVIADGSGAAFIGAAHIADVLIQAELMAARERLMADDLQRGSRPSDVLGRDYEEMLHER